VCIVTTNSRAGLGLGLLAAAIVLAYLARGIAMRWRLAALAGIALLAVAVATSSAFEVVSGRVDSTGDDPRWQLAVWSWPLAKHYAAFGSGLGSFKTLYQAQEPLAHLIPTYVNAVHDDYLQLVIEAGLPGLVVLLLLVLSLVGSVVAWRTLPRHGLHRREMAAGLAVIALFAVHSALDYPLRRPAAWILFSIALASVYRAPRPSVDKPKPLDE
jgi:O-antigen ligase